MISKLLWNISHENDKKYVLIYYIKGQNIWETLPKQVYWVLVKIFKSQKYFEQAGYTYTNYAATPSFSIQKFYRAMQPNFPILE